MTHSLHRKEDIDRVRELLNAIEPEMGYGFYRPANPNNFQPDHECCSPEEIAAHKAAQLAYEKGEYTPEKGDGWVTPDLHLLKAPWGIGTYQYTDPNIAEALALLDAGKDVEVGGTYVPDSRTLLPGGLSDIDKRWESVQMEPRLQWCETCGEGVTDFCRGKGIACPYGFRQPGAAPKETDRE